MGAEEFFNSIRERCSCKEEYATELLKARGFLLEDKGLVLSKSAHPDDEDFLRRILRAEKIGDVSNGIITFSHFCGMENIFDAKYGHGGETHCYVEKWKQFVHDKLPPRVPIELLEPFVARYVKAISACGVRTCCSCDGNHPQQRRILIECDGIPNVLWHKIICRKFLLPKFKLDWDDDCARISFSEKSKWNTYLELNRAAEFLYSNRLMLRGIRRKVSDGITNSMARHMSDEELSTIFSDRVNELLGQ